MILKITGKFKLSDLVYDGPLLSYNFDKTNLIKNSTYQQTIEKSKIKPLFEFKMKLNLNFNVAHCYQVEFSKLIL